MQQKRNKFSIVMPVYNVEKYIEQSLESILEQTFEDFIIYPDEYILNKNLKGLIKLPNRGKIIFYNRNTKNSTSYTIRVR